PTPHSADGGFDEASCSCCPLVVVTSGESRFIYKRIFVGRLLIRTSVRVCVCVCVCVCVSVCVCVCRAGDCCRRPRRLPRATNWLGAPSSVALRPTSRSEERRVGKECSSRWS